MKYLALSVLFVLASIILNVAYLILHWQILNPDLSISELYTYRNLWSLLFWSVIPAFLGYPLGLLIALGIKYIPKLWAILLVIIGAFCATCIASCGLEQIVPPMVLGFIFIRFIPSFQLK